MSLLPVAMRDQTEFLPLGPPSRLKNPPAGDHRRDHRRENAAKWFENGQFEIDGRTGEHVGADDPRRMAGAQDGLDAMLEAAMRAELKQFAGIMAAASGGIVVSDQLEVVFSAPHDPYKWPEETRVLVAPAASSYTLALTDAENVVHLGEMGAFGAEAVAEKLGVSGKRHARAGPVCRRPDDAERCLGSDVSMLFARP